MAEDWVNMYLHVSRIVSISAHLCHRTNQPMIYIYYNEGYIPPATLQARSNIMICS